MKLYYSRKYQPIGYSFQTCHYDRFQVIIVCQGRLMFQTEGESQTVLPGDSVILPYNSGFRLSCPREGYCGIGLFAASEEDAGRDAYNGLLCSNPHVSANNRQQQALADLLNNEIDDPTPGGDGCDMLSVQLFLGLLGRQSQTVGKGDMHAINWAEKVGLAIERSIYSNQDVRTSLNGVGLSYRQLSRHFVNETGMSPKAYQLQVRLREAKRLLRNTGMTLSDVAYELGFSSLQHFSTAFRREYDMTPGCYRRN
jgi:AraC-like DNA-binding protein